MTFDPRAYLDSRIKEFEEDCPSPLPSIVKKPLVALAKIYFAWGYRSAERVLEDKQKLEKGLTRFEVQWLKNKEPFTKEELEEIIKEVNMTKK